jgi:hypothetical protein
MVKFTSQVVSAALLLSYSSGVDAFVGIKTQSSHASTSLKMVRDDSLFVLSPIVFALPGGVQIPIVREDSNHESIAKFRSRTLQHTRIQAEGNLAVFSQVQRLIFRQDTVGNSRSS